MKTLVTVVGLLSILAQSSLAADQCSTVVLKAAKQAVEAQYPNVASQTRYQSNVLLLGGNEASGPEADVTAFNKDISSSSENDEGAPSRGRFFIDVPVKYNYNSQNQIESCDVVGTPTIDANY
jgi:hypothetical protein